MTKILERYREYTKDVPGSKFGDDYIQVLLSSYTFRTVRIMEGIINNCTYITLMFCIYVPIIMIRPTKIGLIIKD